ncbi:MAG: PD-(D/E)XK nuclease family protein [Deltaproteobacteria bacterium]|nr:PD-(D/E)XK nuclease family protein [Deltaproteobacteria bacterium]
MTSRVLESPSAAVRLARASEWLSGRGPAEPVLIVAPSLLAASQLVRQVAVRSVRGAAFGWRRTTLHRLAGELAAEPLAREGLTPAGALPLEALARRVVHEAAALRGLGRLQVVADRPGLPRALWRTLEELRLAGAGAARVAEGSPEIGKLLAAWEAELERARLIDRAGVIHRAVRRALEETHHLLGLPLLLLDVQVDTAGIRHLVRAVASRSPDVLATVPSGDGRTLSNLESALDCGSSRVEPSEGTLARLQVGLFEGGAPGQRSAVTSTSDPPREIEILSGPGAARECVELVRRLRREADRGVPFERMAILLRDPAAYRPHVEDALRRAGIPAHFSEGTWRPDPAGRSLLALLACVAEGLSARRFTEYLSLGELPAKPVAPPGAPQRADRWVPPDDEVLPASTSDELLSLGAPGSDPAEVGTPKCAGSSSWEELICRAAVIGGRRRWEGRLSRLARELELDRAWVTTPDAAARIDRSLADLEALTRFALPLLDDLEALPARASWGEWIEALSALAMRALRQPSRVLSVLAELGPMATVGPVDLAEARLVLGRRLTHLVAPPERHEGGRVLVAPVDACRGLSFEVVCVPGLAERIFPRQIGEDPLLGDAQRRRIAADLTTNDGRVRAERLALRLAVGAASSALYVSYPRLDLQSARPRVPSFYGLELIRAAEGRLPGWGELVRRAERGSDTRIGWPAPESPDDAIDDAEHDLAVLRPLLELRQDCVGGARYLLGANPHLARALRSRARRWIRRWTPADGIVDPMPAAREALKAHALGARSYSPTALQTFASCPYRFFLYAVHKLAPREEPAQIEQLDALCRGSLFHEALYELFVALRDAGRLPLAPERQDETLRTLDEAIDRVAGRAREDLAPAIDRVWDDEIASIRTDLREWLRLLSEDRSGWLPWRFELSFGLSDRRSRDPASQDDPVPLDGGLILRGSIDLVERHAGTGALRVTDYKTGKARAQPGTVVGGGEKLQPVLYALALEKLFSDGSVQGGRLCYCTAAGGFEERFVELDGRARSAAALLSETIGSALEEGFLPAAPAPGACTYCDYRPICGPYEELRTGKVKPQDRLASLNRLRSLA